MSLPADLSLYAIGTLGHVPVCVSAEIVLPDEGADVLRGRRARLDQAPGGTEGIDLVLDS